jgi:predicted transcriptional regulator
MSNDPIHAPPVVTVESLMITNVHSVSLDMTVKEAIGLLLKHGISGAPVIDSVKKVISIISQSDLMKLAATKGLDTPIASSLGTLPQPAKLIVLKRTATFTELYRKFLAVPIHRIIITDDNGRLLGLISRSTVLKVLYGATNEKTVPAATPAAAPIPKKKSA